jgi:MoxR-like ATPase
MSAMVADLAKEIEGHTPFIRRLQEEVAKVIVGQRYMIDRLLMALIADGHILIEGIPGLAKTTAVKAVADAVHTSFARIQFTPDLLPADVIGTEIYRPQSGEFTIKKGPVFCNLLLADEINRAPAKVQSALLEAMQERQVTIGEQTHALPDPFLVLATQNPIEQEGTYPLPEAQMDRFMLKLKVGYPNKAEEKEIMRRMTVRERVVIQPVLEPADIIKARTIAENVYLDAKVEDYIVDIVFATREPRLHKLGQLEKLIEYGASPRATIFLAKAAKVQAFMNGRAYVTPQDVKTVGPDILRHRIIVTYEAEAREMTSDDIIQEVFNTVDVP